VNTHLMQLRFGRCSDFSLAVKRGGGVKGMDSLNHSDGGSGAVDVAGIARDSQLRNARVISLTLAVLSIAGAVLTWAIGSSFVVCMVVLLPATAMIVAYVLAQKKLLGATTGLLLCAIFVQHVGAVWVMGILGPTPFVAPVAILLAAATTPSRHLYLSLLGCLVSLAVEGALVAFSSAERGALGTAVIMVVITFVVSLLHSRGVERAFAVAEQQAAARDAFASDALETEKRFRLLAETAEDLVAILRPNGETVFLSASHERVFGVPIDTLSRGRFTDHLSIENLRATRAKFDQALAEGNAHVEIVVVLPGRGRVLLDAKMRAITSASGPLMALISRDITEQRAMQERLHASERLEALGRLAGSVAHDFNNALTVIQGSTELVMSQLSADSSYRDDLQAVLKSADLAAALAGQLLTFSRRQLVVREPNDIAFVLREQEGILKRLLGKGVQLEYAFDKDLPPVIIPKIHLAQLAMNFAANARDAMPAGGRFRIAATSRRLLDREVGDLLSGDYVELRLQDTGIGLSADVLNRLFEPFFSTKGSQGTGLGLATCQAIVTQAGGKISVQSVLGQGATFCVLLPVARRRIETPKVPFPARGQRRVLVVDDDASVRDLITRMLESEGFEVVTASTSGEARTHIRDNDLELDAMVTDVVLGQERGTDLLLVARAERPDMRILVISGYTPEPESAYALTRSGAAFLAKPFGRDQLLTALVSSAWQ
jgi:PAS domain S-box-containing protein